MKKESKREWQGMACGMIMLHFFLTTLYGLCDVSVVVSEVEMGSEASLIMGKSVFIDFSVCLMFFSRP